MKPHENRLANNVLALAAQVLNGDFGAGEEFDEERLRNQLMRIWRHVDVDAPKGVRIVLREEPEALDGLQALFGPDTDSTPPAPETTSTTNSPTVSTVDPLYTGGPTTKAQRRRPKLRPPEIA